MTQRMQCDAEKFTVLSPRIERFRDASRERGAGAPASPRADNICTAFFETYAPRPHWERYARSLAHALRNEPVYLFDDEQLVGMTYQVGPGARDSERYKAQWEAAGPGPYVTERLGDVDLPFGCYPWPGHIGWRWDRVLRLGVEGLMDHLRGLLRGAKDTKAKRLYRGGLILWQAALDWNRRHVEALCVRASTVSGAERERLGRLIDLCRCVPRRPASTFHEAVQSFLMQYLVLMYENPYGGNGPGRLDYFLWPYLERDLAAGRTGFAEAKDLVDELFVRLHERIQPADGWVEAVMVGGSAPDGSSSLNPLSHMMIESIGALGQTHPSVYVRLSEEDPEDFKELVVRYVVHGRNRAQVYNEKICLAAIMGSGVPERDARMFMAGGCMEISVQGMASDMNFTGSMNVAKTLELVLNGGHDLLTGDRRVPATHTLADFASFDALYAAFEQELSREFREFARALDIGSEAFSARRPCYLLSSLLGDCLERGREQHDGGARYHDYGFSPLGITAASDSLNAIRRAVYEARTVPAEELLAALRDNYAGREALRHRLAQIPRYGVEDADADAMAGRVLASVSRLATGTRTRLGGSLKPMIFSFVWIPGASAELGARADGQPAGARIGHGVTPQHVAMTNGITSAMNSCLSLDCTCVSGGATSMWDLAADLAAPSVVAPLLERFLRGGGMIYQGNTTSVAELEDALRHPDGHPDLMVRVGGYSARFVTLSPELQEEIATRYRHRR